MGIDVSATNNYPTCLRQLISTCLLMKCLKGFSSSSSGMFSMERSTEEHRELFLEAEIFLVAIFYRFFEFFVNLYIQLCIRLSPPWFLVKSDVDWTVRWEGSPTYIGPGCLKAPGLPLHIPRGSPVQRLRSKPAECCSTNIFFNLQNIFSVA